MESCGLDQLHPGIGFPGGSVLMNLPANAGDAGSIPGSRRSPEGGNNNPLQYSCLGNPINSGAWWATVHRIAKSQTRLSDYAHTNTHTLASRWHLWSQTPSGTDYGARRGSFSILTSSWASPAQLGCHFSTRTLHSDRSPVPKTTFPCICQFCQLPPKQVQSWAVLFCVWAHLPSTPHRFSPVLLLPRFTPALLETTADWP